LFVTFRLQTKQVDLSFYIFADDNSISLRLSLLWNGSNDERSMKTIHCGILSF